MLYCGGTTVSTHCHCCNLQVSLELAHKLYRGLKSSAGAIRRPLQQMLELRYGVDILFLLLNIAKPLLDLICFPNVRRKKSLYFPSLQFAHHPLADPVVSFTDKVACKPAIYWQNLEAVLSLLVFRHFPNSYF